MMRRSICSAAIVAAGSLLASACGDEQETKTETVVQTVRASPPAQPTRGQTTTSEASSTGPAGPPLPDGLYGADGAYEMDYEDRDADRRIQEVPSGTVWKFTTTCDGGDCAIDMRRELDSGGYKPVKLKPAEGRPNAYVGTSSSSYECGGGSDEEGQTVATRQRYSIRLSSPAERKGRKTAQSMDVYVTETTNKCGEDLRDIVHYRGSREQ